MYDLNVKSQIQSANAPINGSSKPSNDFQNSTSNSTHNSKKLSTDDSSR